MASQRRDRRRVVCRLARPSARARPRRLEQRAGRGPPGPAGDARPLRRPRAARRRGHLGGLRRALSRRVEAAQLGELVHEPWWHALHGARADVAAEALLEAVAAATVVAPSEVLLRLTPFGVGQRAIQEVLEELF